MAMGILRDRLTRMGLDNSIAVHAAGVYALDGQPPTRGAQRVLAAREIDISAHRAQTVTLEDLQQADLIIVMTDAHRRSLFYLAPDSLHKVLLLSELVGEHVDIPDPFGGPIEEYEAVASVLEDYIDRGLPTILERLGVQRISR